jgi:hypothetical protein
LELGSTLETTYVEDSVVVHPELVLPPFHPCQPNIKVKGYIYQYNILQVASGYSSNIYQSQKKIEFIQVE